MEDLERMLEKENHELASFVHSALFSMHVLGIYYNIKKRRYLDAGIHTIVGIYDLAAAIKHVKRKKYLPDRLREAGVI